MVHWWVLAHSSPPSIQITGQTNDTKSETGRWAACPTQENKKGLQKSLNSIYPKMDSISYYGMHGSTLECNEPLTE